MITQKLLALLATLLISLAGQAHVPVPQGIYHLAPKAIPGLLGAATISNGFNFPTSSYSFSDNDTINAGDFDTIINWIGLRNATDTTSLSYAAFNPNIASSTGSLSVLSSTTGQVPVNKGGSATGTYVYGVVIASGTQAFTTIAPLAAGNALVSNGSAWTSNTASTTQSNLVSASTTLSTLSGATATTTVASTTITANTFGANGGIVAHIFLSDIAEGNPATTTLSISYGGTSVSSTLPSASYSSCGAGSQNYCSATFDINLFNRGATNSQFVLFKTVFQQAANPNTGSAPIMTSTLMEFVTSTMAIDSTIDQPLSVVIHTVGSPTYNVDLSYIEKLAF